MKKFILFFSLISSFIYSQREYVNSTITFNDGKELYTKIKFHVNLFQDNLIDEQSLIGKKITTGDEDTKDVKYLSSDIKSIVFTDLKNKNRIFKSLPEYRGLVEVKFEGKINWYRSYSRNGFDHSTQISDYLQKGDKKIVLSLFSDNKKNLEELTSDKPELAASIDAINYNKFKDEDLLEILKKYNN